MKKMLLPSLILVIGVLLMFSFKQVQQPKKYLILEFARPFIFTIDENGVIEKKEIVDKIKFTYPDFTAVIAKEINRVSANGYSLVSEENNRFIFEKSE